ncbi:hypothetical protein [Streptomyces sp. NPDC002763]|uniref:hypothetical protein n=1 Tax=Streptomyces sp. NPDC002763 TaxID=3154427 RepID=UPI003329CC8B
MEAGLGDLDGEEEPGAGAEVADVDVPAVRAGRDGVDRGFGGRGDAHDAGEGTEGEAEVAAVADREPAPAVVSDGRDDAGRLAQGCLWVFAGQGPLAVPVADHPVGSAAEQGQDLDLQYVAGPCADQCGLIALAALLALAAYLVGCRGRQDDRNAQPQPIGTAR